MEESYKAPFVKEVPFKVIRDSFTFHLLSFDSKQENGADRKDGWLGKRKKDGRLN
jgi:hypothetical protein